MKLFDLMEALEHAASFDWNLGTSRQVPLRDMRKAVKLGLAESAGQCVVVDGDGFTIEPERYSEAFRMTDLGRKWLKVAHENRLSNGYPCCDDRQILALTQATA